MQTWAASTDLQDDGQVIVDVTSTYLCAPFGHEHSTSRCTPMCRVNRAKDLGGKHGGGAGECFILRLAQHMYGGNGCSSLTSLAGLGLT